MNIEGLVMSIAKLLTELLGAERCTIRIPTTNGKMLKLVAAYGIDADKREKYISTEGTIAGMAFVSGEIINIPDISKDDRYYLKYLVGENDPKSLLAIPLKFPDQPIGVAQIYAREEFSSEQTVLAETFSQFAALALFYKQFSLISRRAIIDVAKSTFECKSSQEIFMRTVEKISEILQIPRCVIYLVSPVWCEITAGVPDNEHGIGLRESLKEHPDIEYVAQTKQITLIEQPLIDQRTAHFRRIIETKGVHQILYVPLIFNNELRGVIALDATGEKENFNREEIELCEEIGELIALMIGHDEAFFQEMRHQIFNPNQPMGRLAERLLKPILQIYEISQDTCKESKEICKAAKEMVKIISEQLFPNAVKIKTEADRIDSVSQKVKQSYL